jgi:hypothetical protein
MPIPMDAVPPPHISPVSAFSTDQHAESPKPPTPTWTGILIVAPSSVTLGTTPPTVMVRGTYRIKGTDYPTKARWKLVVTDPVTNKPVSAEMGQRDPSPVAPDPLADQPIDDKTKAKMTYVGHFNAELFLTTGMVPKPGNYIVRAELGPLRSNEIAIKVVTR